MIEAKIKQSTSTDLKNSGEVASVNSLISVLQQVEEIKASMKMEEAQKFAQVLRNLGVQQALDSNTLVLKVCPNCTQLTDCHYVFENNAYCTNKCVKESMLFVHGVTTVCNFTGLGPLEIKKMMVVNEWSLDECVRTIDNYVEVISSGASVPVATMTAFKSAGVYNTLSRNLSAYNTLRGGANGFKGFVFEELHAAKATLSGTRTTVLSNNSVADFLIVQPNGTRVLGQAKAGYNNVYIDFKKYAGQTIVVDKGNTQLIQRAKNAGLSVIESDVSLKQSKSLAGLMRLESKILSTSAAPITSKLYSLNQAGLASARTGGAAGAGFSIGNNIVNVFSGDKDMGKAGVAIARDTAVATASSYAIGALASTSAGTAVVGGIATVGTTLAGTTVGTAVVAGAGAVSGAAVATTTAFTGAIATSAVGTAVTAASTAMGGTVVGTAITGAAVAVSSTAVGAAAIAAAPIVIGATIVGGAFAIGKKLFEKKY